VGRLKNEGRAVYDWTPERHVERLLDCSIIIDAELGFGKKTK
jgi:hypothetical protein